MELKNKLVEIRTSKGLTQEELAVKCNITVRTIQRIESGKVHPRPHTIRVISEALDFDLNKSQRTKNYHFVYWWIKDLFNLKTNKMKKVSILTSTILTTALVSIIIVSKIQAQSVSKEMPKSGVTIRFNSDKSIKRIDAVFTNNLTLDSLLKISEVLEKASIKLKYRNLEFDEKGQLLGISCDVEGNKQLGSGSFSIGNLDSLNSEKAFGFYYDYTKNAKTPFCTGSCW